MILNWLRQHWRGLLVALVLGAAFLSGSWFGASKANTAWALKWKQRNADDATALAKRQAEARAEEQRRQGEIDAIEKRAEGQIAQAAADADHAAGRKLLPRIIATPARERSGAGGNGGVLRGQ